MQYAFAFLNAGNLSGAAPTSNPEIKQLADAGWRIIHFTGVVAGSEPNVLITFEKGR